MKSSNKTAKEEEKWKKAIYWVFDVPHVGYKPYEVKSKPSFFNKLGKS
jgi:hypothetical protein